MKRRKRMLAVASAALLVAALMLVPRLASAATIPVFLIRSTAVNPRCMTWVVENGRDVIILAPCNSGPGQLWVLFDGRIADDTRSMCVTARAEPVEPIGSDIGIQPCRPQQADPLKQWQIGDFNGAPTYIFNEARAHYMSPLATVVLLSPLYNENMRVIPAGEIFVPDDPTG